MATIAVRVGREIKEISGLTKSTTCWDVVLALLKEKQLATGTDSANGATDKTQSGDHGTEESASNSSTSKSIKELAQSHVIVENWRGCEKPIPPRTRILNVWQAWGKEQRHVELSLKKSKHIRFREGGHIHSKSRDGKQDQNSNTDPDHSSLHYMSSHQKRRIRRNMRQYQRAVMMRQNEDDAVDSEEIQNDICDSTKVLFEDTKQGKSEKRNGLILSEEKFIDGFLADPDCLIRRADRAELISQGTFNREFCKYRRRNRRRHGSIDSRQHRRRQVSHYPYSSQHDRRRSSRHRVTSSKSPKYRYSTDDTSTTTTTTNTSEDENADDADDEKSVLIEFARPIPRRSHPYGVGLGGRATATDSSTTTSGDSMTSSMGCSTSSETSSGGDYFLPELNRLSYGRAIENMKNLKASENSSNKPKKNKSILGGLPKPALNLIESFRKTNLKRKSGKKNNQAGGKQEAPADDANIQTEQNCEVRKMEKFSPKQPAKCEKADVPEIVDHITTEDAIINGEDVSEDKQLQAETHENTGGDAKAPEKDDVDEQQDKDDVFQTVQSQGIVLENQRNRLTDIDAQIEQIQHDVHDLRTQALGKNYVQDAYLSGAMELDSSNFFNGPSIPVTTPWILQSDDAELLERFIKMSEKIVEMQIKIEEHNRKSEMLLQDMQEEVWRVSADAAHKSHSGRNTVTKAAALMLGLSDEDDSSEDEDGHEILSVKSWNEKDSKSGKIEGVSNNRPSDQDALHLQLETSRTELESSLYLSLRLSAEIEEVEEKLGNSDYLIQKRGEDLIKYVRDLAMSEEGVDPEIWEEYGELLTAYDIEVQHRNYLEVLESSHVAVVEAETASRWTEGGNTLYIDATSPNPTSHCVNGHAQNNMMHPPPSPSKHLNKDQSAPLPPPALHQALSPWMFCEHCKMEEQMMHVQSAKNRPGELAHSQHPCHPNIGVPPHPPTSFSQLPLPRPINKSPAPHSSSVITSGLLPMLPIPAGIMSPLNHNDSDYDDLPDLTSMGPPDPSKSSRERALLDNEASNNTDDSGNASAGSTTSFASSDGSRNSSCDGGSPRPIPTAADMAPGAKAPFGRRHFVFPSQNKSAQSSKNSVAPPPPPASIKPRSKKPEPLPKPKSLQKTPASDTKERETLLQQQRLIRRNSGGRRKPVNNGTKSSPMVQPGAAIEGNTNTFKEAKLQNVSSGKLHPIESQRKAWNNQMSNKSLATDQKNLNYDNDSDTGRSSLHSVDSDQLMFSETLV